MAGRILDKTITSFEEATGRLDDAIGWVEKAKEYAHIVMSGRIMVDVTQGATHYHATYVRPAWAKTKKRTTRIDKHIFYRWE